MGTIFRDKFTSCIKNYCDISKPSYTQEEINFYADFVELMILLSSTDGITFGDIQDRFFGEKDYGNAEQRDEDEGFLKNIENRLRERVGLFKEDYPFIIRNEDKILTLKPELTGKNKLYLLLLLSSKLNIFNKFQKYLTNDFEKISYFSLRNFLPNNAIVKEFGKNTEYTGTAIDKIKNLANDLGLSVKEYELSQVGQRNNQERGLDLIGWIPFEDNCRNKIIYLCQCACGKEYESKQHDTRRFENYLEFYKTKPQHTMFIPYSLINTREGKFYHSDYIEEGYLIFERKRILNYITETDFFENLESKQLVEECIIFEEDIV